MKRIIAVIAICALTLPAMAQMAGLPVADDAAWNVPLSASISGGLVLGDDFDLYGARFTYALAEEFSVFGGGGIISPDHGDDGWGLQGGAIFALPIEDIPFDLAARGTVGYGELDQDRHGYSWDIDVFTFNAGLLASKPIEMVTVYGYLGLNYTRTEVSHRMGSSTDSDTDPALGAGVLVPLNEQVSLYGEVMHINDPWFGFGVRFDF